jgi:hypothetical protein
MLAAGMPGASPARASVQSDSIILRAILSGTFSQTMLSGTFKTCFSLEGAFSDQGGGPTWSSSNFTVGKTMKDFVSKCERWQPTGGFVLLPPAPGAVPKGAGTLSTLWANWHLRGQQGQIFLQVAGTYDLVKTFQGSGSWIITGGTGAYADVQGEGTCTFDASPLTKNLPFALGIMTGRMYQVSSS